MKVSIRESKYNHDLVKLQVYRQRERKFSLSGGAYETKSGRWIVHLPGEVADVVDDKAAAVAALKGYYAGKEG